MKNSVTKFDLEVAFKELDKVSYAESEKGLVARRRNLAESVYTSQNKSFTETLLEDYYDLEDENDLTDAAEEQEAEVAQAKLARIEKIVDLDAKTADELLPSYVGKVIIQCPQCMNLFYKNEEDIEKDPDDPTTCNVNEPCQHCGNISGYTLIGKVDKVSDDEMSAFTGGTDKEPDALDLGLNFDETNEEGTDEDTEAAEETTDEENTDDEADTEETDEDLDLDLNLESLNNSKAQKEASNKSDLDTEHHSKNVSLNEAVVGDDLVDDEEESDTTEPEVEESLNNSNFQKKCSEKSELDTDNHSKNLSLEEGVLSAAQSVIGGVADGVKSLLCNAESEEAEPEITVTEAKNDDTDYYKGFIEDACYFINDDGYFDIYGTDLTQKAQDIINAFDAYVAKKKYGKAAKAGITAKDLEVVNTTDGKRIQIPGTIVEGCTKQVNEDVAATLAAFEASLDDTDAEETAVESINNPVIDESGKSENKSENSSLNENNLDAATDKAVDELNKLAAEGEAIVDKAADGVADTAEPTPADMAAEEAPVDEALTEADDMQANSANFKKMINDPVFKDFDEEVEESCKLKESLNEAVAITISVDEVEDDVMATEPAAAMVIAEPEATATYTAEPTTDYFCDFPDAEPEACMMATTPTTQAEVSQEVAAEIADDVAATIDPEAKVTDNTEDKEAEAEKEDDAIEADSDEEENAQVEATTDAEEATGVATDEEEVEEALTEGVFDRLKNTAKNIAASAKNLGVKSGSKKLNKELLDNLEKAGATFTVYSGKNTKVAEFRKLQDAIDKASVDSRINDNKNTLYTIKGTFFDKEYELAQYLGGKNIMDNVADVLNQVNLQNKSNAIDTRNLASEKNGEAATKKAKSDIKADTDKKAAEEKKNAEVEALKKVKADVAALVKDLNDKYDLKKVPNVAEVIKKFIAITKNKETTSEQLTATLDKIKKYLETTKIKTALDNAKKVSKADTATTELDALLGASTDNEAAAEEVPVEPKEEPKTEKTPVDTKEESDVEVLDGDVTTVADELDTKTKEVASEDAGGVADEQKALVTGLSDEVKQAIASVAGLTPEQTKALGITNETEQMGESFDVNTLEECDELAVEECINQSLCKVYENISNFKVTDCAVENNKFIVEGLITFKSGRTRSTTYVFNEAVYNADKVNLSGLNEMLDTNSKFSLICSVNNNNLIAESLSYSYTVDNTLVEGLVNRK